MWLVPRLASQHGRSIKWYSTRLRMVLQRVLRTCTAGYDTTSFCKYKDNNRLLDTLTYYHVYIPVQYF